MPAKDAADMRWESDGRVSIPPRPAPLPRGLVEDCSRACSIGANKAPSPAQRVCLLHTGSPERLREPLERLPSASSSPSRPVHCPLIAPQKSQLDRVFSRASVAQRPTTLYSISCSRSTQYVHRKTKHNGNLLVGTREPGVLSEQEDCQLKGRTLFCRGAGTLRTINDPLSGYPIFNFLSVLAA